MDLICSVKRDPRKSNKLKTHNDALNSTKSKTEGQGNADSDAVRSFQFLQEGLLTSESGLDNAGKTTIVKRIMGEDVNSVSPTLGFIIKTIDYEGYVSEKSSYHHG